MQPLRTFAVLVGIDDYSVLDRSLHLPPGTSDNGGAVYDVMEWYHLFRDIGAENADIHLLTAKVAAAPRPTRGGEHVTGKGAPTRENVLHAAAWMRRQLALHRGTRGMFVYSGHGDVDARGVATLCTADAAWRRGRLEGAVGVDELMEALGGAAASDTLTLILDTCHAGATGRVGPDRARTASRPSGVPTARLALPPPPFPTLVACAPEERSYEIPVGRVWRGAFSWSLLRVIQRWGLTTDGAEIAYADLVQRASDILTAMGVDQTPAYQGPPKLRNAALFLKRAPTGVGAMALGDKEIDPGACDLRSPDGTDTVGHVYAAPATSADAFPDDTVYWWGDDPTRNPLVTMDVFDLVRTADVRVAPPPSPWMVHANGVFTAWVAGSPIPFASRWYRWSNPAPAGAPPGPTLGWLGVQPGSPGVPWLLVWLSARPLEGRAKLALGQSFRFERLAGPPPVNAQIEAVSIDSFTMP